MEERSARRVLFLSTASFTLLFAVWVMLGVLGVAIRDELHLGPIELTWLTAIAILNGSIWRLPFGLLTDRYGGKVVMIATLLGTAIPTFFVSRAHSFEALLIDALLFGIAGNSFSVGVAWNAAWFDRQRQGLALGIFGAGNVGASLTKLIGPSLIALVPLAGLGGGVIPGGWRFVPVLYAALLVLMALAVWWLAPATDRRPASGRSLRAMLAPLRAVRVWRFGLYYVVVFGAYVALSLFLPDHYTRVYGLSLAEASLWTAAFIFPASLLRPLGGWLADRFGARRVTYAVFGLMLIACAPLAWTRVGLISFVVLVEILGIGMGIGKASVYKYIPDYYPSDVGAVGGVVGTLGALGGFFIPIASGYLERASGRPQSAFAILFGLIALSLGWLHLVVLRMANAQPTPSERLPSTASS
jgi:NNP family nitrate/nitrite transporter-like MFS transporter